MTSPTTLAHLRGFASAEKVLLPHRVQNPALNRFQTVADVGQSAGRNDTERVIEVPGLCDVVQRDLLHGLFAIEEIERTIPVFSSTGAFGGGVFRERPRDAALLGRGHEPGGVEGYEHSFSLSTASSIRWRNIGQINAQLSFFSSFLDPQLRKRRAERAESAVESAMSIA